MSEKRAFITGGSRGLGFAVMRALLALNDGWIVERPSRADMDLRVDADISLYCNRFIEKVGSVDLLVNCAGVLEASAQDLFQVNAIAPARIIQHLYPVMTVDTARVINISSTDGLTSKYDSQRGFYSASKAALNAYTRIAAMELGDRGIAVNAMCPGWIKTDMGGPGASKSAEEAAKEVIWLATEVDADITGQFFKDRRSIPW